MTELAEAMIDLGAADAINLDGGGSASLVVGGELVNAPREEHGMPLPGGRASRRRFASRLAERPEDADPVASTLGVRRYLSVLMGFYFYPRGGSAHACRSIATELGATDFEVTLLAGSRSDLGEHAAERFFAGADLRPVDFTPALAATTRSVSTAAPERRRCTRPTRIGRAPRTR